MDRIEVLSADITSLDVDAIVNAANERMLGGGGVDGAIHRAAGPELVEACRRVPEVRPGVRCPTGEARITPGFRLPARHVLHTVGPVWRGGQANEPALLASCYRRCLALAEEHELSSIAFPAISCGVFRFPIDRAALIAVQEVTLHLSDRGSVSHVIFAAFDRAVESALRAALEEHRVA